MTTLTESQVDAIQGWFAKNPNLRAALTFTKMYVTPQRKIAIESGTTFEVRAETPYRLVDENGEYEQHTINLSLIGIVDAANLLALRAEWKDGSQSAASDFYRQGERENMRFVRAMICMTAPRDPFKRIVQWPIEQKEIA